MLARISPSCVSAWAVRKAGALRRPGLLVVRAIRLSAQLEWNFPYQLTVSPDFHCKITPTVLVGRLKLVDDSDGVRSRAHIIGQVKTLIILEPVAVANTKVIERHLPPVFQR